MTNSVLAFNPNHTFTLEGFNDAREVIVTGTFNDWNPDGFRMIRNGGTWICPVHLSQGKHLYKFIIDGEWMIDPANRLWEQNEHGTGNSILWIK
ncbi:MAG: hypothetical protein HC905_24225 [Bacteroidales bacterium]|nr:hypothetical protein [Bacteroidales bacterium]